MADAEKFQETTFVKTDERGTHELVASTPADAVRLRFDGWREKGSKAAKATAAKANQAAAKPQTSAG